MSYAVIEQLSIRSWQDSDFASAVTLNREAEEPLGIPSESGDWAKDMVGITDTFIEGGGEFLVGLHNEKLVVMGGFKKLSEDLVEIKRMRVTPELQGHGIGRWFLGLLEARILDKGIIEVDVSTRSDQPGALRLYSGAGYTEIGRRVENREHDSGLTIVSFHKTLSI